VPIDFDLLTAVWLRYGPALEQIVLRHPLIFEGYVEGSYRHRLQERFTTTGEYIRDDWGCLWHNVQAGLVGQVVEHPLADWRAFDHHKPPDVRTQYDRRRLRERTNLRQLRESIPD